MSEAKELKILDLFAGLGGSAKGIQKTLNKQKIKFEYFAIEINPVIAKDHKLNNPESNVVIADCKDWFDQAAKFDFVWASPPCQTHSKWNVVWNSRRNEPSIPDDTLWFLIRKFRTMNINFVIENVDPYYPEPLKYTVKIDRHCFWSSFPIRQFSCKSREKNFNYMTTKDWSEYHELQNIEGSSYDKRQALRNATHFSIAAGIFEQFLKPRTICFTNFIGAFDQ